MGILYIYIYHNKTGFMSTWFRATIGNSANKSMSSLGGEPVHEFEEFDLPSVERTPDRTGQWTCWFVQPAKSGGFYPK